MDDEESTPVVNETVATETTTTDSTPVENNGSDAADTTEEVSQQETEGDAQEESEQSEEIDRENADTEETDTETDKPQSKGEKRVDQLNTEIRDLVAQRNAIRQEVETLNSQVYKPATVDELLNQENPETGEYYNRLEAQLEAMRQEREVEKYNNQVSESLVTLESDVQRVLNEFPMFDAQSAEYNEEVAGQVAEILNESLIRDPNTQQVIGTRISPYKLYKSYAVAAKASAVKAETKAQKNVETMLKNADPTTSRKGAQSVPFEKMSLDKQRAYLRSKGHDV